MHNIRPFTTTLIICILTLAHAADTDGQTIDADSTSFATSLQEVTVTAPESTRTGNKTAYYPTRELQESMATSSQLLAGLQIPELIVNPATGEISISGGGTLSIRINGRRASPTDLMAISSKDITKVEYIANPGAGYGDAAGVLNVTVKKRSDGYGIVLNLLQSPNRGWGDYTAGLRYNRGRSEWSADYHSNPMWQMDCYRDNREIIHPGDHDIVYRSELGIKTPNRMVTHRLALQYSYAGPSGLLVDIQARLFRQNDHYASKGTIITDFNGTISEGLERETAPFTSWQGDLDLYIHRKINARHRFYINIVPTLLSSVSDRRYETEEISTASQIKTDGWLILSEGIWEGRFGAGMLSAGIRGRFHHSTAEYLTDRSTVTDNSTESHCFAEWNHAIGNVRYTVGIDGSLFCLKDPVARSYFNVAPTLSARYTPVRWGGVSLSVNGNAVNPTLAQLSPAMQRIDRFQYTEGNPDLTPYCTYRTTLEFDVNIRDIQGSLSVTDKYAHRPVMGAKRLDDGMIIQSYYNAGSHNDFIVKGQIRTPVVTRRLTLSVEGGWHRMSSNGVNYRHTYSQPFVNAQLMLTAGKWWFMAKYNNAYNILWGEMISSVNNNLLNIGLGYRYKDATFMAGIVNPIGNVSLKSRDLSAQAGYERTYHASSTNCLAWIGMTVNTHIGSRRSATKKKLDNNTRYETIKTVQK